MLNILKAQKFYHSTATNMGLWTLGTENQGGYPGKETNLPELQQK